MGAPIYLYIPNQHGIVVPLGLNFLANKPNAEAWHRFEEKMMNILFVDDRPAAIRFLLSEIRAIYPECNILVERNLIAAIKRLQEESIDLVIIDLFIPGELGSLIKFVKQNEDTFMKEGQFLARYCNSRDINFLVYSNVIEAWSEQKDIDSKSHLFDKGPEGTVKLINQVKKIFEGTS